MQDQTFYQLVHATKIMTSETMYFQQVAEWKAKRETLLLQLADFPNLIRACLDIEYRPYELNQNIQIIDRIPTLRLANACEATANGLYSMAEIAANFANKATKGTIPSSFNKLCKKCEADPSMSLVAVLGDLQWYRKVREIRTEWTHYSSIFVGGNKDDDEVLLCIRGFRRDSDKREFTTPNFSCTINEFLDWVCEAIATLDRFAGYLLKHHVIPCFDLDKTFTSAVYDKNGVLILKQDGLVEVETITVRDYLARASILDCG